MDHTDKVIKDLTIVAKRYRDIVPDNPRFDEIQFLAYLKEFVLPEIATFLGTKMKEINQWHTIDASPESDASVIHYTSLNTLTSILKNFIEHDTGYLRMNDSFHLNDPDEGQYLIEHLQLSNEYDWLLEDNVAHAYIASFILAEPNENRELGDEDDLAYWLAYGNRGIGCSIKTPISHDRFRHVLYGNEDVVRTAYKLDLRRLLNALSPFTNGNNAHFMLIARKSISDVIWRNISEILYLYKREAYDYEKECRMIRSVLDIPKNDIRFSDSSGLNSSLGPRHYLWDNHLKIDELLVTGSAITLGPRVSRPENVKFYVEKLLEDARLGGPTVEISKIPYQGD